MAYMNKKVYCDYCLKEITRFLEEKGYSNMEEVLRDNLICPECGRDLKYERDYRVE